MPKISVCVLVLATIIYGNLAYAHPQLQSAEPPAGAGIASPKEIRITFSEPVIARYSGIGLARVLVNLVVADVRSPDAGAIADLTRGPRWANCGRYLRY